MDVQHLDVETSPAPGGPPRFRSGLGAALVVLVAVGGVAAAMFFARSQDARPIEQAAPTTTTVTTLPTGPTGTPTTTIPAGPSQMGAGEDAASRYGWGGYGSGTPLPPLDLPTVDYTWANAVLPVDGEAWLMAVVRFQGRYLAFAAGPDQPVVWESSDGATWTAVATTGDVPVPTGLERVLAGPDRLYVVGHIWPAEDVGPGAVSEAVVWTSTDGVAWSRGDLGLTLRPYENVWFNTMAAGPSGAVLFGTLDYYPPGPPARIEKDGKIIVLDSETYTYRILDASTNAVLASGSQEEMWNYEEDGQVVADPVTGETIVVIPWDVWSAAYDFRYEGLEIGDTIPARGATVVEYDGVRVTIDEQDTYTFRAEDIAGGALLAEGSLDDLYRGPSPRFRDASGAVILTITWQELDRAYEQSAQAVTGSSQPVILVSADGTSWDTVPVNRAVWGDGQFGINSIVAGPQGYLAAGNVWPLEQPGLYESESYVEPDPIPTSVWRSPDGRTWEKVGTIPDAAWVGEMVVTPTGYLAIGGVRDGASVLWSSNDGSTWSVVADGTSLAPDDTIYFERLLTDDGTIFVTGTRQGPPVEPALDPATITGDGRTLTMSNDGRYVVTETATGEVLADIGPEFHEGEESAPATGVIWTADGLLVTNEAGVVVFRASNQELETAWADVQPEWYQPEPVILTSTDLATWSQVAKPEGDVPVWYQGVSAGDGALMVFGSLEAPVEMVEGAVDATEPYIPPTPVILIGRPA